MKSRTKISWADFTLNAWEGCTKVSDGCRNCYAAVRNARNLQGPVSNWGPGAPRRSMIDSAIGQLKSLNRRFGPAGDLKLMEDRNTLERWILGKEPAPDTTGEVRTVRPQIFSLSLGDVLDVEVPVELVARWLAAVAQAENLEFLMLTKRPERFDEAMGWALDWAANDDDSPAGLMDPLSRIRTGRCRHVAWGTSVESGQVVGRAHDLARIPAHRRFISAEPLLGDPQFSRIFRAHHPDTFHLVISGGESGVKARPMHPSWITGIDQDCKEHQIPHHAKQWGTWVPAEMHALVGPADNNGNKTRITYAGRYPDNPDQPSYLMHRAPSKDTVPLLIDGKVQQPRLNFE